MTARTQKWLNTGAFLAMIAVNALANIIPIGIGNTGTVSKKYANLFTPAPYTFAIWGAIYLLMGVFVLYQWGLFDAGTNSDKIRRSIGPWFAISCVLNIGWVFAWHYDVIWLSMALIAALLLSLMVINDRNSVHDMRTVDTLCVTVGFDIYFGWIIAATIANICVYLTSIGWNGWGLSDSFWTVVIVLVGAVIGSAVVLTQHRWLSGVSIIWAYGGIFFRHITNFDYAHGSLYIIAALFTGITAIICAIALSVMSRTYKYHPTSSIDQSASVK